jgi:hypothetical protein
MDQNELDVLRRSTSLPDRIGTFPRARRLARDSSQNPAGVAEPTPCYQLSHDLVESRIASQEALAQGIEARPP